MTQLRQNKSPTHFQKIQRAFCQHVRHATTPEIQTAASGNHSIEHEQKVDIKVSARALTVYNELLFGNVCSFVNITFPISRNLLGEETWGTLLSDFFAQAKCQSPFYHDISLHFREYLSEQRSDLLQKYVWLEELLQYEWLELYLDIVELPEPTASVPSSHYWQLKTSVWVLVYQYPVFNWSKDTNMDQVIEDCSHPNTYILAVWRDQDDDMCSKLLSPVQAIVLEQLSQEDRTETTTLHTLLQQQLPHLSTEQITDELEQIKSFLQHYDLLD